MLNRKKLKEMLKHHDWFYDRSDDQYWYNKGRESLDEIYKIIRNAGDKQNEAIAMYNSECPEGYEIDQELYHS
tara:strand:- start:385 stop:603 length:219 start_codon:yes stop_codon:yes gene_type:complete